MRIIGHYADNVSRSVDDTVCSRRPVCTCHALSDVVSLMLRTQTPPPHTLSTQTNVGRASAAGAELPHISVSLPLLMSCVRDQGIVCRWGAVTRSDCTGSDDAPSTTCVH